MVLTKCPIQNGTELWTPGDEYNKFWREGSPKLLKTKLIEQFGTPLPRGRLIILVTRRPEFSAILNWVLYEMSHGLVHYDGDRLESVLFNPIDRPEVGNMLSSYLDPDSNFVSRLQITGMYSPLCTLILVVCLKVSINLN